MTEHPQPTRSPLSRFLLVLVPLALMLLAFVWIAALDPLRSFNNGAPPVEGLTVERTILDQTGIQVLVRAGGSEPMVIAQVLVDDAYWSFAQDPAGPIARRYRLDPHPLSMGAGRGASDSRAVQHRHGVRARDCRSAADA